MAARVSVPGHRTWPCSMWPSRPEVQQCVATHQDNGVEQRAPGMLTRHAFARDVCKPQLRVSYSWVPAVVRIPRLSMPLVMPPLCCAATPSLPACQTYVMHGSPEAAFLLKLREAAMGCLEDNEVGSCGQLWGCGAPGRLRYRAGASPAALYEPVRQYRT